MATTTKTLTPTNQTITLPDMTERPNASVLVDGIGKDADAINALSEQITKKVTVYTAPAIIAIANPGVTYTSGEGEVDLASYIPSGYRISIPVACMADTGSLTITGCTKKESSNTIVKIRLGNASYSGTAVTNIFVSCLPIS